MADQWAKLALNFFRHPKSRAIGKDGRELFLASICWSRQELTDGFVPTAQLPLLAAEAEVRPATAKTLVAHDAWHPVDGGWMIHDYGEWQQTRAHVEAEREKWRKQKRGQRGSSTADMGADSTPGPPDESEGESEHVFNSQQQLQSVPPLAPAAAEAINILVAKRCADKKPDGPRYGESIREREAAEHWLELNTQAAEGHDARWLAEHVLGMSRDAVIEGAFNARRTA